MVERRQVPGDGAGLFLVELRAGAAAAHDVLDMHHALRRSVARLAATGREISWDGAVLVADGCRCLCLVQAARKADVVLARDTAALATATVHPVRPLDATDAEPESRSPIPKGRT